MENENEERGLDHLIEQNSTELGFLDIYGEGDDQGDEEILSSMLQYLRLHDVKCDEVDRGFSFDFGKASIHDEGGVEFLIQMKHLPLVPTDVEKAEIANGVLDDQRCELRGVLFLWTDIQLRFFERLIEHYRLL